MIAVGMEIGFYAICHLIVDGACAFAMFGWFNHMAGGYWNILLYNFCAFALQMPIGAAIDLWVHKQKKEATSLCKCVAVAGMFVVLIGLFTHPVVLGIGNALFHVGGGIECIRIDERKKYHGAGLGIFVAPGALGLFLGKMFSGRLVRMVPVGILAIAILGLWMVPAKTLNQANEEMSDIHLSAKEMLLILMCFMVVVIRSMVGMESVFPWKSSMVMGLVAIGAVVFGKAMGGILAANIGIKRTVAGSLMLAAITYAFSANMISGVMALFFFNMTMPITLYLLIRRFSKMPGFFFGLLTFGLFLGFLPTYLNVNFGVSTMVLGCVGSVVSLLLLVVACLC